MFLLIPFFCRISKGTKKLALPKISSSFRWNAPEVISLSAQGCLYIMAKVIPKEPVYSEDDLGLDIEVYSYEFTE